jgi:drug/metabolite transporter (DMT)-like permease
MKNFLYYALIVAIWGSTWYGIKLQLNGIPTQISVAYRFAIATLILFAWCLIRRVRLRFAVSEHLLLMLLGVTLFSTNYLLFYEAEKFVLSGHVAIIFSLLVVFNILNGWLFFGLRPQRRVIVGAMLGMTGILLTFWRELQSIGAGSESAWGIVLTLAGTILASLGNMVSARLQKSGIPVVSGNAFGMLYGTIILLVYALLSRVKFSFDPSISYAGSLLYLALFGSVVAFGAYLSLVGRIGADRAAYATVLFPIVALLISVIFEGYKVTVSGALGITCILLGNWIVLATPRT